MWVPKHILCVIGNWSSFEDVRTAVMLASDNAFTIDEEYSLLSSEPRMVESFESCRDRARPSWTQEDRDAVARHQAVVYVMSPPVMAGESLAYSAAALRIVAALLRAGGTAAKSESAGIAHGRTEWLRLADAAAATRAQAEPAALPNLLRDAFVRLPLLDADDEVYYTCGMHLLGQRDFEMPAELDAHESIRWFDRASDFVLRTAATRSPLDRLLYLDDDVRIIADGGPCLRYPEDSFFYNPYGYWALLEIDDSGDGNDDASAADATTASAPSNHDPDMN